MSWEVRQGDALVRLREMSAGSVQTCITSPPYFGLRDYGTGEWEGGDEGCDHRPSSIRGDRNEDRPTMNDGVGATNSGQLRHWAKRESCETCGARRVDQQVGLEQTPDEYVARLVGVFREVRRVLRDDGTLWLNLGDSYASSPKGNPDALSPGLTNNGRNTQRANAHRTRSTVVGEGVKPKDLIGVPWAVAFALRTDGWYLRSDIVWSKPNPMPESVTDRPTKAHEYLFLLSKQRNYFYDADAIREDALWPEGPNSPESISSPHGQGFTAGRSNGTPPAAGRNKRSVWTVATQPFPGAHFAVFPPKLIEPCVLAGSSPKACGVCGGPWVRMVERIKNAERDMEAQRAYYAEKTGRADGHIAGPGGLVDETRTVGWEPSCSHNDDTGQSVVLDPFAGAGTTGLVAVQHGRSFIGIELNESYAEMARERIATAERLGFRSPDKGPEPLAGQTSLLDEAV